MLLGATRFNVMCLLYMTVNCQSLLGRVFLEAFNTHSKCIDILGAIQSKLGRI